MSELPQFKLKSLTISLKQNLLFEKFTMVPKTGFSHVIYDSLVYYFSCFFHDFHFLKSYTTYIDQILLKQK